MKNAEHIFFITLAVISGIFIDRCPVAAKTPPLYSTTATHPSTTAASHCTTMTDRSTAATSPSNNTADLIPAPGIREAIPFGDFEQWTIRRIKESAIVGKDSVTVYEIDRNQTIYGNIPYSNTDSPWATSNAFAKVRGVVKTNVNVRPAPHITRAENSSTGNRGERCAEMRTEIMSFKILGMAKVEVLTAGAIYLGKLKEPINSMDNAIKSVNIGIPFTKRPKYLVFDYKATIRNSGTVSRSTMTKRTDMPGRDRAIATVQLQKRTEKDGKIYAERVATGELLIGGSCDWIHGAKLKLTYGKPENEEALSQFSRLNSFFYAENSSGESVPIQETGWADPDTAPTHLIIYFASGYLGPFTGEIGNSLSIDNVMLEY